MATAVHSIALHSTGAVSSGDWFGTFTVHRLSFPLQAVVSGYNILETQRFCTRLLDYWKKVVCNNDVPGHRRRVRRHRRPSRSVRAAFCRADTHSPTRASTTM